MVHVFKNSANKVHNDPSSLVIQDNKT